MIAGVVALGGDGRDAGRAARRGLRAVGQAVFIIGAPFPIGADVMGPGSVPVVVS